MGNYSTVGPVEVTDVGDSWQTFKCVEEILEQVRAVSHTFPQIHSTVKDHFIDLDLLFKVTVISTLSNATAALLQQKLQGISADQVLTVEGFFPEVDE